MLGYPKRDFLQNDAPVDQAKFHTIDTSSTKAPDTQKTSC
nr:hypothetical protein [Sicyoidochytrium minutum DNA virus]